MSAALAAAAVANVNSGDSMNDSTDLEDLLFTEK
jgi:hypothetical protein